MSTAEVFTAVMRRMQKNAQPQKPILTPEDERERIASELEYAAVYYPRDMADTAQFHAEWIRTGKSYDEFCEDEQEKEHGKAQV